MNVLKLYHSSEARAAYAAAKAMPKDPTNIERVLENTSEWIKRQAAEGKVEFYAYRFKTHGLSCRIRPKTIREKILHFWEGSFRISLNDAGIETVIDKLKEIGYHITDFSSNSAHVRFTISWT